MRLITQEYVQVDKTASPLLIKSFIDPQIEFIFVSTDIKEQIVKEDNAKP